MGAAIDDLVTRLFQVVIDQVLHLETGVVRAKAWKRGDPEPEAWSIEVPHGHAHREGAPGLYGFSPNVQHRVFIDNVSVTPSGK